MPATPEQLEAIAAAALDQHGGSAFAPYNAMAREFFRDAEDQDGAHKLIMAAYRAALASYNRAAAPVMVTVRR
jgi:hypothetical protein